MTGIDLDDVGGCPVAASCAGCGATDGLAVVTADVVIGVICMTLCRPCTAHGCELPRLSVSDAAHRVCEHCTHLGVDLDQAAAAQDAGGSA